MVGEGAPGKTSPGFKTLHFDIPANWTDAQAAAYILKQFADDLNAHSLAIAWSGQDSELYKQLRDERFRNGLVTVAELAKSYYLALAGLSAGGQAMVAVWNISQGNKLAAALDAACLLPIAPIAMAGLERAGGISIQAGEKVVALLPAKAVATLQKLAPEQKALLHARLLAAKTEREAAEIAERFLALPFDRHHPLPKFLGGNTEQLLYKLPKEFHKEFHAVLREDLKAAGLTLPIGGKGGSTDEWLQHFFRNPGSQAKGLDAVLKASRTIDKKYGTSLTQSVWSNLTGGNIMFAL
jgi:hypothetical protein